MEQLSLLRVVEVMFIRPQGGIGKIEYFPPEELSNIEAVLNSYQEYIKDESHSEVTEVNLVEEGRTSINMIFNW